MQPEVKCQQPLNASDVKLEIACSSGRRSWALAITRGSKRRRDAQLTRVSSQARPRGNEGITHRRQRRRARRSGRGPSSRLSRAPTVKIPSLLSSHSHVATPSRDRAAHPADIYSQTRPAEQLTKLHSAASTDIFAPGSARYHLSIFIDICRYTRER